VHEEYELKFLLLLLLEKSVMGQSTRTIPGYGFTYDDAGNLKIGGTINVTNIFISTSPGAKEIVFSTAGFSSTEAVEFSSNVTIAGELRVNSTKAKAIFLPTGGIHVDDGESSSGATAPGQMFSKKIVTSTITLQGSAILFQNSSGVVKATMTATILEINGVSAGKLKNNFKGEGAPLAADCDEENEEGTQYLQRTPSRMNYCASDGAGGYGWRFNGISQ